MAGFVMLGVKLCLILISFNYVLFVELPLELWMIHEEDFDILRRWLLDLDVSKPTVTKKNNREISLNSILQLETSRPSHTRAIAVGLPQLRGE